jgi:hypothetical protein
MYVYGIKNLKTNKLVSRKAAGGRFYMRAGDARKKMSDNGSETIVKYLLVQVENDTYSHGRIRVYQMSHGGKLFSRKDRAWEQGSYVTYELVEVPE